MNDLATIDRIEGEYAVCELQNGEMVDIHLNRFNERPSEGDIFNIEKTIENNQIIYNIKDLNTEEMERRRKAILEKINRIKNA